MRNPFIAFAAAFSAAMAQANNAAIKEAAGAGIRFGRAKNRFTPRSRDAGPRQPAGSKLARMALESRIGKMS